MKLSIIVPVYNTSEYIDAFCDNLFPQLDECTEVIFVDDGSYDDSINKIINKCNNYCCDSAVKIISQVNRGLSAARNNGIKNSSGDYITFIDSDDYVSTQYIETIISNIDDSVDLLTFNANVVDNKGLFLRKLDIVKKQSDNSEEVFYDIFNLGRWYAWCRVFNKKLIKDDFFPNGKRFEDLMSIPTLYRHCNKSKSITNCLLNYRTNPHGITSNPKEDDIVNLKYFCDSNLHEMKMNNYKDAYCILIYISSLKSLYYVSKKVHGYNKTKEIMRGYLKENNLIMENISKDVYFKLDFKNKLFISYMMFFIYIDNLRSK